MTSRSSLLGMAMVLVSLVLTTWAMYHLMRTGSCGSNGVYVSTRPCPAGTGGHVLALMGGIVLALAGMFAAKSPALGILWFGLFFTLTGSMAILVAVGPASPPGAGSGGIVMGALFIVLMGVPPVLAAFAAAGKSP